jgi:hypothetical protein
MARTKRSKQIAQFVGRQSHLPGMLPSRSINTTGNARQGRHFDLVVKDGRTFHNYGNGEVYEVGPAVATRQGVRAAGGRLGLGSGLPAPASETFNRRDVSTREPKVKGRKKLVSQFLAKNGQF